MFSVGNDYHQDCVCSMTRDELQRHPKLDPSVSINVKTVPIVTKFQLNKIEPEHHDAEFSASNLDEGWSCAPLRHKRGILFCNVTEPVYFTLI